jgi:hypothetical protein
MPSPRKVAALSSGLLVRQQASAESYQAAVADDLAGTVEHVLNTRYAGARLTQQTASRPHPVAQVVTSESLLAELAAARQSTPSQPRAIDSATPRRSGSRPARVFAFVAFAMIVYALLMKSPWRDQVPSIDRIAHLLN